jgi:aminoglycoside phosphotransferase (APT) family kinase protein
MRFRLPLPTIPNVSHLGPLIATGRTAEVFAYGEDAVAKVLLPEFDAAALSHEADIAEVVAGAGVPTPAPLGRIEFDGRPGLLLERVEGEVMVDRMTAHPLRSHREADLLGRLHAKIHASPGTGLTPIAERLADRIDQTGGLLAYSMREAAKHRLRALDRGDRVLHGDFHPGNVLVGERTVAIDWVDAASGPPEPDVVRTLWLLSLAAVPPEMRRPGIGFIVNRARHRYQAAYEEITGLERARLAPWRLPVLAARLAEGIEHEEEALVAAVSALARG